MQFFLRQFSWNGQEKNVKHRWKEALNNWKWTNAPFWCMLHTTVCRIGWVIFSSVPDLAVSDLKGHFGNFSLWNHRSISNSDPPWFHLKVKIWYLSIWPLVEYFNHVHWPHLIFGGKLCPCICDTPENCSRRVPIQKLKKQRFSDKR